MVVPKRPGRFYGDFVSASPEVRFGSFHSVPLMSPLPPKADIASPQKTKGTDTMAGPPVALAFRNNRRRRRGFALAVRYSVGLCRGRDAKESHHRCSQ